MAITEETAREMQRRSVVARRRNNQPALDFPDDYKVEYKADGLPNMQQVLQDIIDGQLGQQLRQQVLHTLLEQEIKISGEAQKSLYNAYWRTLGRSELEGQLSED